MKNLSCAYEYAREQYAAIGVDTEAAIAKVLSTPVSLQCWQGDDVKGFETLETGLTGGIMSTGAYPGKARNGDELRADLDRVLSLIPGTNRINIHAFYLENGMADRDAITPANFSNWADWAVEKGIGLDFNPTFFSHPKSDNGTLSAADESVRKFWIDHLIACREISAYFGERTGKRCGMNIWIPDGCKERPIDTLSPRLRLTDSLEKGCAKNYGNLMKDAVESKLFGIGSESYVVGSHEYYMGYAMKHPEVMFTMDTGHYHPTELVSSKLTAIFSFVDEVLLHVSRGVRWDSDHVVSFDDETQAIMSELVRSNTLDRTNISLDYFDGSINRVAALVIGARNTKKALLKALLEPADMLKAAEAAGDTTSRLALTEEYKSYPFGIVWEMLCERAGVPGANWLDDCKAYEREVTIARG